ncbi:carbohydrate ABC transporter permease [Pseudoduganella umbonata]|uniref:Sorbitol/mannitol transport system permease protein n=1 Tax=Pseudoduganella umbonata TaxID=864828 RepID=A0A4P8HHS4_9BURK|nr:sugar ABC transporter permease [Pseudoduganella umbonata]MBB3221630.1 sorbitol/mannitol transport system permease protein [Pseudoduganella umbonata]QCP09139.1 sugar ABC transporter permease [Pseudoduganella umbonata]
MTRFLPRTLLTPAVLAIAAISIVPLLITLYYAFVEFSLLTPGEHPFHGVTNFQFFFTDGAFLPALKNTFVLMFSVMLVTVLGGAALGLLINEAFPGRAIVRVLLISPFLVMPAVNALMWKNMLLNPIHGLFAQVSLFLGQAPVDWLSEYPMLSIIMMVSWQWLPFACLIFMTALQSMDREQLEAAGMDGANYLQQLRYLYIPHLGRAMSVVLMIEMIFLLSIFAEIFTTTGGGPGFDTTTITFMIYQQALQSYDIGAASAGALFAVLLANIAAFFLMRVIGRNLSK